MAGAGRSWEAGDLAVEAEATPVAEVVLADLAVEGLEAEERGEAGRAGT